MVRLAAPLVLMLIAAPVVARPQREAAAALKGRTPGPAQTCITIGRQSADSRVFDDHAALFDGGGGTVYLNRLPNCPVLTARTAIVTRVPSNRLCRGDIVDIVEVPGGISRGPCSYGDFIPYAPPRKP